MSLILNGIRVLEVSTAIQGPAAGQFLADLGAEVVKVEPPLGDASRYVGMHDPTPGVAASQFIAVNRGKQSVCLDAHSELGRAVLHGLAARSDVFLSNYRAPALARMQLDAATLQSINPRLIYAAASGFGPLGDDADKAMVDGAAQARGGLVHMTGPAHDRPTPPGAAIADTTGAMTLALGIMSALFDRERGGSVRRVDTSALGGQLFLQMWELQHAALTGETPMRVGPHHSRLNGPVGVYTSSDGVNYLFALLLDVNAWQAFWQFAGDPESGVDVRWDLPAKQFTVAAADLGDLHARMSRAFARQSSAEWEVFFAAQPELVCERVRPYDQVLSDPQNIANGYVATMALSAERRVRTVGNPLVFDRQPRRDYNAPPARGDATATVMRTLGFNAAQIDELEAHTEQMRRKALGQR